MEQQQEMTRRQELEELALEAPSALEKAQRAEQKGDEQASALLDIIENLVLIHLSVLGHQQSLDNARAARDVEKVRRYGQHIRRDLRLVLPLVTACKQTLRLGEER